jgi:hypothetical protein
LIDWELLQAINRHLRVSGKSLDAAAIMAAVQRNFGGHPENMDAVLRSFFSSLNLPQPDAARLLSVATLIEQNLEDVDARHLMVLTKVRHATQIPFIAPN